MVYGWNRMQVGLGCLAAGMCPTRSAGRLLQLSRQCLLGGQMLPQHSLRVCETGWAQVRGAEWAAEGAARRRLGQGATVQLRPTHEAGAVLMVGTPNGLWLVCMAGAHLCCSPRMPASAAAPRIGDGARAHSAPRETQAGGTLQVVRGAGGAQRTQRAALDAYEERERGGRQTQDSGGDGEQRTA